MVSHTLTARDRLLASLSSFVSSPTDHSIALVGAPGTGRTALLAAAERMASDAGYRLARLNTRAGSESVLTELAAHLRESDTSEPHSDTDADDDATDLRQTLLSLARRPRSHSLLIGLDDADQLDDSAAQTLSFLCRRLAGSRVKLVTTCVPGVAGLPSHAVDVALAVHPLDVSSSDHFLRLHFPSLDSADRRRITLRGDGRPRELVRAGYLAIASTESALPESDSATVGLDYDDVADLLQRSAAQALRHGDSHTAADNFRLSAARTTDPPAKARRLAAASALVSAVSADIPTASALLYDALSTDATATHSLEAVVARSYLSAKAPESIREAQRTFARAIRAQPSIPGDRILDDALWSHYQLCHLDDRPEHWSEFTALVAQHAATAPEWALIAAQTLSPDRASHAHLDTRLDRLIDTLQHSADSADVVRSAFVATSRSSSYWWRAALHRVWSDPRSSVTSSVCAAWMLGSHYLGAGRWDEAQRILDGGIALCRESGLQLYAQAYLVSARKLLSAYRGELLSTSTASLAVPEWISKGVGVTRHHGHLQAVTALGAGNPRSALRIFRASKDGPADVITRGDRAIIDLAEAASECESRSATESVAQALTAVGPGPDLRLAFLRAGSYAIVTDDVEAYRSAIATPGADRWPFDVARVRLHFGRRLRMNGLGRAAREELYQALSTFTVLGADHWSARTADELRLLGESVTTFTPPRRSPQISATANRIAEMAVSVMSNRAIAARMGIAPSTVGSHLSHVYRTVGVRSRTALRDCALFT